MWRLGWWLGLISCVWLTGVTYGQSLQEVGKSLQGLDAAFTLTELRTGAFVRLNEARCDERFPPFETFEVPAALAVLDARLVRNLEAVMPWNRLKYPPATLLSATDDEEMTHWTQDQTLRSAFTHSVAWYWWEVTERLGAQPLRKTLHKLRYGNQLLPESLTYFWQEDALRISAQEQTVLLQALAQESLPFSLGLQRNLKTLLLRERGADYRLYLKTGTGLLQNGHYLGWSIGWLESGENVCVFAFNLTHRDLATVKQATTQLPKRLLTAAGYWAKTAVEE